MNFSVIGGASRGLRIYKNSELFMYSEVNIPAFAGKKISIFNNRGFLILVVKEKGFFFKDYLIIVKDESILKKDFKILNKVFKTAIGTFYAKTIGLGLFLPTKGIFMNKQKIAEFKLKFSDRRKYKLDFSTTDSLQIFMASVLFLVLESVDE